MDVYWANRGRVSAPNDAKALREERERIQERERNLRMSIDARLQLRAASLLATLALVVLVAPVLARVRDAGNGAQPVDHLIAEHGPEIPWLSRLRIEHDIE